MDIRNIVKNETHLDSIQDLYDWVVVGQCEAVIYYLDKVYGLEPEDGALALYDLTNDVGDIAIATFASFEIFLQEFKPNGQPIVDCWEDVNWVTA